MRKLMLSLALLATLAVGTAVAIDVNSIHTSSAEWDGARASGNHFIITSLYTSPASVPSGILLWTGDGSDYYMRFVTAEGGVVESLGYGGTGGQRIPSYFLLPVPAAYDSTANGDGTGGIVGWKKGLYVTSPTDSLFYRWTWE
jgi:hypothetical protein